MRWIGTPPIVSTTGSTLTSCTTRPPNSSRGSAMTTDVDVARQILKGYGQRLKEAREAARLDRVMVAAAVRVDAPRYGRIEHGEIVPTVLEADRLADLFPDLAPVPSARWSDVEQSHDTVRSIAGDRPLADRIIDYARSRTGPTVIVNNPITPTVTDRMFDDQDLTEYLGGQRNVIARARGLLEQSGQLVRVGSYQRAGRIRKTLHFVAADS